jgi:hypothetical protein
MLYRFKKLKEPEERGDSDIKGFLSGFFNSKLREK